MALLKKQDKRARSPVTRMLGQDIQRNEAIKQSKRKVLAKKIGIGVLAGATAFGAVRGVKSLREASAEKRQVAITRFQSAIPGKVELAHTTNWFRISKVYRLNPSNPKHVSWMRAVNNVAKRMNLPPERIVQTMHVAQMEPHYYKALESKIASYQRANSQRTNQIKAGRRVKQNQELIRINNSEIERLKRVQNLIGIVEGNPQLVEFYHFLQKQGLRKASDLESEFGLRAFADPKNF